MKKTNHSFLGHGWSYGPTFLFVFDIIYGSKHNRNQENERKGEPADRYMFILHVFEFISKLKKNNTLNISKH